MSTTTTPQHTVPALGAGIEFQLRRVHGFRAAPVVAQ